MNNFKLSFLIATLTALFACTQTPKTLPTKTGYLEDNISQAELSNPTLYKRYYYTCDNAETGSSSYLSTYFPLSRESRLKDNFGIYFQLDGGKPEPFDHIENKALNSSGTRFEVAYRSYHPIQGAFVDLMAYEHKSIYYKNHQGIRTKWLVCRE
ncbi:hypothetical protein RYD26_03165 [Pasteurellaceae bacterium LIM206]|nr:hypothetical protein [Pasteurellaceae bacterium LIM206]